VAYILKDADVKVLLIQNVAQLKRLKPSLTSEHNLRRIVINTNDDTALEDPYVCYLNDWLPSSSNALSDYRADPKDLASIIYTSGTTGKPKGVMLSHDNMLSVASKSLAYFDVFTSDVVLSFLPLSHTLERTASYYLAMMAGATVAYSRGIPQLAEDMKSIQPTIMFTVPRVFERIYSRINQQLEKKSSFAKWVFKYTTHVGWLRFLKNQKRLVWRPSLLLWPLLDKVMADKVRQQFGGKMRLLISGGAALPHSISKTFIGCDLCILQGYGLTETSPVISVNEPDNNYPDSVGRPIPGVDVKIGENDELLCKGPGNMLGYWNNHKATSQVINSQGWLHTGDQARISETGHIYITGRIKDIIVMSNGEKVPPNDIESAILVDDLFDQVIVIGEGQSFLSAILVLNPEHWFSLAKQYHLDSFDSDSLKNKELHAAIVSRLRKLLHDFPSYARIRKVTLTLVPWSTENDLLTATLKVRRPQVIAFHQTDINAMYDAVS
jgi:long-chain acyl-CoA synthetase